VSRNVSLVPELLGWDPVRRRRRVAELLDLVGLSAVDHAERYPVELSGGQRQRVAVARALAADPDVVLLDEPFGALDPITRAGLQKEFAALRRAVRKTMLLVTHDLAEAFRLADRIAVLRGGRLLQIGTAEDLVRRPAEEYVRALVAHAEPAS
jgi:osmoprotectant transport system ATP-binding protein